MLRAVNVQAYIAHCYDRLQQALTRRPDFLLTIGVGYCVSQQISSFVTGHISSAKDYLLYLLKKCQSQK